MVILSLRLRKFYYNYFWIEKGCNIHINWKYKATFGLRPNVNFFIHKLVVVETNWLFSLRLNGVFYNGFWIEIDFNIYKNLKYVTKSDFKLGRFYYNFSWIEKHFNIYVNLKNVMVTSLGPNTNFFNVYTNGSED